MTFIPLLQAIVGVLLVAGILIQHRASGLSATFGGSGENAVVQRRGAEKVIYRLTIWSSVAFFALTVIDWYV